MCTHQRRAGVMEFQNVILIMTIFIISTVPRSICVTNSIGFLVSDDQTAKDGQFPWMVAVHHLDLPHKSVGICGGTVISSRWVLTAAHCLFKRPRSFLVVFGDVDKNNFPSYQYYRGPGVAMITNQVKIHPEYSGNSSDIGLLYMPSDIPFNDRIQPIKLAGSALSSETFIGSRGTILGWGATGASNNWTRLLRWGIIRFISDGECSKIWKRSIDGRICTAGGFGSSTCKGDSGGPLTVQIIATGEYLQVGIVSHGHEMCPSSWPSLYTRVSYYSEWIQSVIGINY